MYTVKWEIQVDGDNPLEAALEARVIQLDPTSTATVFKVSKHVQETTVDIELSESYEDDGSGARAVHKG